MNEGMAADRANPAIRSHSQLTATSAKMESQQISLTELLDSRDRRRDMQLRLLQENPGKTLVVVTIVIPGNVKRNADSEAIANAACESIENDSKLKAHCEAKKDLMTGFEAFYLTDLNPEDTKEITSMIEDTHPLGRMMDIDVIDSGGNQVSRARQGQRTRRCLLCDNDARVCMRAFTHSQEELLAEIHRRVSLWLSGRAGKTCQATGHPSSPLMTSADEP